ncbi:MAG: VacJ family lipoprotein [Nitrospirae bacterium]|nr:MAG: VacJ family lipoprotein [Nitrospirota bacterium]
MERHGASRLAVILIVGAVGLSLIGVVAGEAAAQIAKPAEEEIGGDYDPWEPFNDKMFTVNHDELDVYVLKPAAKGYDVVVGEGEKQLIHNLFDFIGFPKRFVNSVLQGKWNGAGREVVRFVVNATLGGAGMTDVAKYQFGIEKSDEDTGQTFGVWGWRQSRYLVLPLLPPLTIRDGTGYLFDIAMDPINYFIPFAGGVARYVGNTVNERALNLETFESVEEGTLDLYSAVRNFYLRNRDKKISE